MHRLNISCWWFCDGNQFLSVTNTGGKFGFRPEGGRYNLGMRLKINLDLAGTDNDLLKMAEVVAFYHPAKLHY